MQYFRVEGLIALFLIAGLGATAATAEWVGPDILNNNFSNWSVSGTSSILEKRVQSGNLHMGLLPRPYWVINTSLDHTMTASRSATVDAGKRYRYSLRGREVRSVVSGNVNVEWWSEIGGGPSSSHSSSTSYVTRSLDYIPGGSSMTLRAKARITASSAELYHDYAEYDWATLQQVVYDPQLDIAEDAIRINTDTPGGDTADVGLTPNSLSYADDPTAWMVDWGDGVVDPDLPLNQTHSHVYTLSGGDSQSWTATFSGDNQAGSDSDTALVEILRQPDIALSVDGTSVLDGDTIELDILSDPVLDLSLLDSLGFIEEASIFIPGRLDYVGTELTFSDTLFDESDLGLTFPLTATISNTGVGVNSDTLSVNLMIVPEPAAAALILTGALLTFRRRLP